MTRVSAVLFLAVAALVSCDARSSPDDASSAGTDALPSTTATSPNADALLSGIPAIVRKVEPSVVTVFAGRGLGSGVVWSADGLIVTVNHVVEGRPRVQVGFADGLRVAGTVEARDPVTDIAVVKVDRTGLPPADFSDDVPQVGELAVAIGSPLGFQETVTAGIISGTQRAVPGSAAVTQSLVDLIQTDAAISPGNSGGALVDAEGRVVGLNEAYIPPAAGAVSIGFAIPAPTVRDVVEQLLRTGRAEHAFLGAQLGNLTPEIAATLGLDRPAGALVLDVTAGGPAGRAGIRPGDVIVRFGDRDISTVEDVLGALRAQHPRDVVTVVVDRRGEPVETAVELAERPAG